MECISCNGSGEVSCWKCEGNAVFSIPCEDCDGAGSLGLDEEGESIACETCGGHGNQEGVCNQCNGLGVLDCERCAGTGNITDESEDEAEDEQDLERLNEMDRTF
jgi:DnaJ-class molecular chaperone